MQTGDLIFSLVGVESNAISAVTEGYGGFRANHMGVGVVNKLGSFVLEAFYPEVRLTNFKVFERRSNDENDKPRLMFGRLNGDFHHLIEPALMYGISMRDVPYDHLYLTEPSALYCSELVIDMFQHANGGTPFFKETPMSFVDEATGEIHEDWIHYYAYFGVDVPIGEPGSSPGEISLDERISIYDRS